MKVPKRKRAAAAPPTDSTPGAIPGKITKTAANRRVAASAEPAIADVPVIASVAADLPVANAPAMDMPEAVMVAADLPAADIALVDMAVAELPSGNIQNASPVAESDPIVTLGSSCTVKDAAALKHSLCAVVDSQVAVTLDAHSLERIDTATIQVLCAFVRQRVADARAVIWVGVPEALQEAARLLGVHALLALPPAGAAS